MNEAEAQMMAKPNDNEWREALMTPKANDN